MAPWAVIALLDSYGRVLTSRQTLILRPRDIYNSERVHRREYVVAKETSMRNLGTNGRQGNAAGWEVNSSKGFGKFWAFDRPLPTLLIS